MLTALVDDTSYVVREEEGPLAVCVIISGASLDRTVSVTVATEDITATGSVGTVSRVASLIFPKLLLQVT